MTVYVVTQGEYSDYRIVGIFGEQNKQMAENFVAHGGGDECEPWELDTWIPDQGSWDFAFDCANGIVLSSRQSANLVQPSGDATAHTWFWGDPITITVRHGNRDAALKIATERYAKIRANLDQAVELLKNSRYAKDEEKGYPQGTALQIAEILAGLRSPPDTDSAVARRILSTIKDSK